MTLAQRSSQLSSLLPFAVTAVAPPPLFHLHVCRFLPCHPSRDTILPTPWFSSSPSYVLSLSFYIALFSCMGGTVITPPPSPPQPLPVLTIRRRDSVCCSTEWGKSRLCCMSRKDIFLARVYPIFSPSSFSHPTGLHKDVISTELHNKKKEKKEKQLRSGERRESRGNPWSSVPLPLLVDHPAAATKTSRIRVSLARPLELYVAPRFL